MAEVLQPYSTNIFNTIPELHKARDSFTSKDGKALVDKVFRPMIESHKLEAKLGVGLLHRHFDLNGSEKLVEFNNISLPWNSDNGDGHNGGKVLPNAWVVRDGKLIPYEFYFSPLGRDSHFDFDTVGPFIREFMQTVAEYDLEQTICLRLFPHVGFTGALEVTEGRANINLSPDQVRTVPCTPCH